MRFKRRFDLFFVVVLLVSVCFLVSAVPSGDPWPGQPLSGTDSISLDATDFLPDGTVCLASQDIQLNSGPTGPAIFCYDLAGGTLEGHVTMPENWTGGAVNFYLNYFQGGAGGTIVSWDIKMQCCGDEVTVDNVWGTEVEVVKTSDGGPNAMNIAASATTVTPQGACSGGDTLYYFLTLDDTTTTGIAGARTIGGRIDFPRTD